MNMSGRKPLAWVVQILPPAVLTALRATKILGLRDSKRLGLLRPNKRVNTNRIKELALYEYSGESKTNVWGICNIQT